MATVPSVQQQPAATGFSRWIPTMPTINLNSLNPFLSGDDSKQADPPNGSDQDTASVMFAEPETRGTSEADSREGSISDKLRSPKKGSDRLKTRYSVCHPAPASSARQKMHRRPRSLLQLHKICPDARPRPAFDVIPSANFSVHLTRATKRVFKAKHSLCPNDLVVLRAEKYSSEDTTDDGVEVRDVIGLICKGKKDDAASLAGKAKICMATGQEWEAYPLPNGGYEFFSTDEHGLGMTVRWVSKKTGGKVDGKKGKQFRFSTISPNSRRHPVIANLCKTSLEVNDTYKIPDALIVTPLSTPNQQSSFLADTMSDEATTPKEEQHETDDSLRDIITVTATWVTFKEGWSPTLKYDDKDKESAASAAASGLARSASLGISNASPSKSLISPLSTPPASPVQAPLKRGGSIKSLSSSLLGRNSIIGGKANRASTTSVPEGEEPYEARSPTRSRGDSMSTVLVHRAASNRRRNTQTNQAATWRPDLLDAQQHPLNETTREHLDRTPPPPQPQPQVHPASVFDEPMTPTHRKDSIAQPLIPPVGPDDVETTSLAGTEEPSTPTPIAKSAARTAKTPTPIARTRTLSAADAAGEAKRVSNATTATTLSGATGSVGKSAGTGGRARKRDGWRRLFCGAKQEV